MRAKEGVFEKTGLWVSLALTLSGASMPDVAHARAGVWTSGGPNSGRVFELAINPTNSATHPLRRGTERRGLQVHMSCLADQVDPVVEFCVTRQGLAAHAASHS